MNKQFLRNFTSFCSLSIWAKILPKHSKKWQKKTIASCH